MEKQRKIDIAEVFSRPRVTEAAKKFGLSVGEAIDIATGWDLSKKRARRRCLKWIRQNKPQVIMISPPCTAFSRLQGLSKWSANKERTLWTGVQLLKFAAAVAKEQVREERHFLFEHPASATSWSRPEMRSLSRLAGVVEVVGDQCMFGLTTRSATGKVRPAKKRTKFMTNIPEVKDELGVKCDGRHEHQQLISGRAQKAEVYPQELCKAICRSVVNLKARLENDFERVLEDVCSKCGRTCLTDHSFQEQLGRLASSISELGRLPRQREAEHAQAGAFMHNCRKRREMLSAEKQRALENLPHWTWTAEPDAAWWEQLSSLLDSILKLGRLPRQRETEHLEAARFLNNCRQRREKLSAQKQRALEELPHWTWTAEPDAAWWEQLSGLESSISELGRLPRRGEAEHVEAAKFINNQRQRRKMLGAEKQRALENLPHWTWTDDRDAAWWEHLAAVEEYLAQHGNLPKKRDPHGQWVQDMRKPDRRRRLSPEQLGALKRCKIIAMDEN